ncbi:hypothetical protein [Geoglobus sp.]
MSNILTLKVYLNNNLLFTRDLGGVTSVTDTISISTTSLSYGQSYSVSIVVKAVSGSTNSSTVTFSTCQKVTQPQGCEYVTVYLRGLNSPYDMYIRGADGRWYKIGTVELTPLGKSVRSWTNPPAVSSVTPGQGQLRLYISGTSSGMLTTTSEEYIADAPSGIVSWAQSNANSIDRAIDTTCPVRSSSSGPTNPSGKYTITVRLIESGIGTAPYYIVGHDTDSNRYYYLGNVYPNVGEGSVWSARNPQSTTVPADAMNNINTNGFSNYPKLGTYEWSGSPDPTQGTNPILTITNPTYRGYTWNVMQGYYVYVNAQ